MGQIQEFSVDYEYDSITIWGILAQNFWERRGASFLDKKIQRELLYPDFDTYTQTPSFPVHFR